MLLHRRRDMSSIPNYCSRKCGISKLVPLNFSRLQITASERRGCGPGGQAVTRQYQVLRIAMACTLVLGWLRRGPAYHHRGAVRRGESSSHCPPARRMGDARSQGINRPVGRRQHVILSALRMCAGFRAVSVRVIRRSSSSRSIDAPERTARSRIRRKTSPFNTLKLISYYLVLTALLF